MFVSNNFQNHILFYDFEVTCALNWLTPDSQILISYTKVDNFWESNCEVRNQKGAPWFQK